MAPAELINVLRATHSLVEHYGISVDNHPVLRDVQRAIERALIELDPEGENERRRLEELTVVSSPPRTLRKDHR